MAKLFLENVMKKKSLAQLFISYDEKQMSKSFKADLNAYSGIRFSLFLHRSLHDQWWT